MIEPDSPRMFSLQLMRLDDGSYVVEEQTRRRHEPLRIEVVGMVSLVGAHRVGPFVQEMVADWEAQVRAWGAEGDGDRR